MTSRTNKVDFTEVWWGSVECTALCDLYASLRKPRARIDSG